MSARVPLPELPRAWLAVTLPGYREHPDEWSTYSDFPYGALPPIGRSLDDCLDWLCAEAPASSPLADWHVSATRKTTPENLSELLGNATLKLPPSFVKLVASDEPRRRIRSATDCYLDLAEVVVPVATGGVLIHFLSDSQFCLHWLLYVGEDGAEAVVATAEPYGFVRPDTWGGETQVRSTFIPGEDLRAWVCAASFSEFLYRLWIENEIFFKLACDHCPLTEEQQRYVDHYKKAGPKP